MADLPAAMSAHHTVRIGSTIHCGGGYTGNTDTARLVFQYNPKQDTWSQLPMFTLVSPMQLDGKLVTVGCRRHNQPTRINDVYMFQKSEKWKRSIPPMPAAHSHTTVVNYQSTIIVVSGGVMHWHTDSILRTCTNAVEVFQTKTFRWHHAETLPVAHRDMSCHC